MSAAVPLPVFEPACMDADEYALWRSTSVALPAAHRDLIPCDDCPLAFALEMRTEGRCNGTPKGVEIDDEPLTAQGGRRMATPVKARVTAPCEQCIHLVVCGRRPAIAELGDNLDVEAGLLPRGVTLVLAAEVICDEFVPAKAAPKARGHAISPEGRERMREAARRTAELRRSRLESVPA